MASITLTIPDAQVPRIVAAVAKVRGVDISSFTLGQKAALLKSDIGDYWRDVMTQVEVPAVVATAGSTAQATRLADIAANVSVT